MKWSPDNHRFPYVGEGFKAVVDNMDVLSNCVPVISNDDGYCGVGVTYSTPNGDMETAVWGTVIPRNLIAGWRATLILPYLTRIGNGTLSSCYYAACREPKGSDQKRADEMIAQIGIDTHKRIMATPIPEDLIRFIIDSQGDELEADIWPITAEVRAGTLEWYEAFSYLGVKYYNAIPSEIARKEAALARFEQLFANLANFREYPRHCPGMDMVEDRVFELLEQSIKQSDEVIVALAFFESELSWNSKNAMNEAASWLNRVHRLFRSRKSQRNKLLKLREQYFPKKPEVIVA
jgi:hypothetical protein